MLTSLKKVHLATTCIYASMINAPYNSYHLFLYRTSESRTVYYNRHESKLVHTVKYQRPMFGGTGSNLARERLGVTVARYRKKWILW